MDEVRRKAGAFLAAVAFWGWTGAAAAAVGVATLALEGDPTPGVDTETFISFGIPSVNGSGEVVFEATHGGGSGIWAGPKGGLSLVAKSGDPAPAVEGATFSSFDDGPVINAAGQVAFQGFLDGGGEGIWVGGPDSLLKLIVTGDLVPDTGGAAWGGASFSGFVLNQSGQVAVEGILDDGRRAVLTGRGSSSGSRGSNNLVALEGDAPPGAGGAMFDGDFGVPVLDGAGTIAFFAGLDDGSDSVWRFDSNGLSLIAKTGQPAAGGETGETFGSLGAPVLNGAGEMAFAGSGGGINGIWRDGPEGLALEARDGDPAPGAGVSTFVSFGSPVVNGAGELAILAGTSDGRSGLWRLGPDGPVLVALENVAAPDAGGPTFSSFSSPGLSGAGEMAFLGNLTQGGSVTAANDGGLWAGGPGSLQLIAREGDMIEVMPSVFRTVAHSGLGLDGDTGNEDGRRSGFSETGQVVFWASFTDNTEGIFIAPAKRPKVHLLSRRAIDSNWRRVYLPGSFKDPVMIAGPPSYENRAPGVIRVQRNRDKTFRVIFQEWAYKNGRHLEERVDFLVMNRGRRTLSDGSIWEAGTLRVRGNRVWQSKTFRQAFPGKPNLFLTIQSFNDPAPVTVRARRVNQTGFQAALMEEEAKLGTGHRRETVGYIAVYSPTNGGMVRGGISGTDYTLDRPKLSSAFETLLGRQFKLEEERSKDRERKHVDERVSVMRFGRGHFAQQVSDKERDTTAIRKRPVP